MEKKILVHSCCAPCSSSVFERLITEYDIASFFYNPNIFPETEYKRRLEEYKRFAKTLNYKIFVEEDPFEVWNEAVRGYEYEPERGKRCEICFRLRLEKTAQFAVDNKFNLFTTVLSVSPHKDASIINKVGSETAQKYGIDFLEANFKKQDGYKRSLELSKEYNLYRQTYCGCRYSSNRSDNITLQIYDNFPLSQIDDWDRGISHTAQYFKAAFPRQCERILDIGIGSGRDMCILHKMGYNVYGAEPSKHLINEVINRHSKDLSDISSRLSKTSLPFLNAYEDNLYDGILCTTVLMHIPEDQLVDCAKNIKRILKNNGHVLLSVPVNNVNENMPLPGLDSQNRDKQGRLFTPLSEKRLRNLFEQEGFTFINKWIDPDGLKRTDRKLLTLLLKI